MKTGIMKAGRKAWRKKREGRKDENRNLERGYKSRGRRKK